MIPIDVFKRCQIPKLYFGEGNSLKTSRDKLGDTLYDLTDPAKQHLMTSALKNYFWLIVGKEINDARQLFFLLARAFALSSSDVFCVNSDSLLALLKKPDLDDEEQDFLFQARNCDILFIDDFHDDSAKIQWSMERQPLRVLIRRRVENEKHTISYSSDPLNKCNSWPESFLSFLGYHIYQLFLQGKR